MTVHKLSAGDGYTYLTRQVASADERLLPGQSLAEYYVARGNPAGVWRGAGAAVLGLEGTEVSEAQMRALFGAGCHPDRDAMLAAGASTASTRLGAPYPNYADLAPYQDRVAAAIAGFEAENGRPAGASERNRLAANEARRGRRAVAGFDLVFSPVKSASLLWGLGGPEVRTQVEAAHHEAVASTIGWLERHAAFTRTGHAGVAQVDTTGLVCAAFDHRESRSGDPDLHTHVAVANKVQGVDGTWRSLDARGLHGLGVAASERYNTRLEDALSRRLGVEFEDRPGSAGKRVVREVAGVAPELIRHFSKRRAAIEDRYTELRRNYRTEHGREPDRATQVRLAQQATLETREGKGPGRTLAEQVADWTDQATHLLGRRGLDRMLTDTLGRPTDARSLTRPDIEELAADVVRTVASQRSTWTVWNLYAEAERRLRPHRFPTPADRDAATDAVIAQATSPARLGVGIGPAGAGKTTAMRAFAAAWQANGGRVVLLASSSKAAQVLGSELDLRAENLHKFLHENQKSMPTDDWFRLQAGDVVVVDEAGMAGTLHLAQLLDLTQAAGASVRLLGDPAQLAAVDAGGALRLLEREVGAAHLSELHRFRDPAEARATLALRAGDPAAIDFYDDHGRIVAGPRDAMLEAAYDGWAADVRACKVTVLIAAATADVTSLNARARAERVTLGQVQLDGVDLHDGNLAAVGDWIVTRANARELSYHRGRDWVRNGDTWQVTKHHPDGSLTVRNLAHRGRIRLPAGYVEDAVELAYAVTAHRVQGATTDTAHSLITPEMTREALYVASTRGRERTTWYAATEACVDLDGHEPAPRATARELLTGVLARTGREDSATDTIRTTLEDATSLPVLVSRYQHARREAALAALSLAADALSSEDRGRILADKAAPHLALVLADAAGRGANPRTVLRRAAELDDLIDVHSPALVLASRIQDQHRSLGIPIQEPEDRPLSWLAGPRVGHPGWEPYLHERAHLIASRAAELGSLVGAYREQYRVTATESPGGLGPPPEPDTPQHAAWLAATAEATASATAEFARTQHRQAPARLPDTSPPYRTQSQPPRLSR